MNCPKCGKEAKRIESIKEDNISYRRNLCPDCKTTFFSKVIETECLSEEFLVRQREKEREKARKKYRRKCMMRYQTT